jgi:hypothetical protein
MKKLPVLKKSRTVFIYGCSILFYTLIVAASVRNVVESGGEKYFGPAAPIIDILSDIPSILKNEIFGKNPRIISDNKIKHHFDFKVKDNKALGHLLVPSFDFKQNTPICNLFDLNTGKSIKKWTLSNNEFKSVFPINEIQRKYIGHPFMLKDSSIVFAANYFLTRMDKNNKILWQNKSTNFHHSIEQDRKGNIWTCMTAVNNNFYPPLWTNKLKLYKDDGIVNIDIETGEILFQKSITRMLFENGYQYLVEGIGKVEEDQIHINDVQPVLTDSEYWKAGDVFISIRHRSTIILYRPSTDKIIWLKTGPWINQHDVDILEDAKISIFGNDAAAVAMGLYENLFTSSPHNNIYVYDFESDSISMPYHKIMKEVNISTPAQGSCEILSDGSILIDETEKGKIYLLDTNQIKFTFSERIDENHIYMLPWVRYIKN